MASKDNLFWLKWEYSEHSDIKVQLLVDKFGVQGYGLYHYLIPQMGLNNNLLSLDVLELNKYKLNIDNFDEIIDCLIKLGLFYYQGEFLSSLLINNTIEVNKKNKKIASENGLKGAEARKMTLELLKQEGKRLDAEAQMLKNQQSLSKKPNNVTQINSNHSINNADSVENSFPGQINKFDIDESFFLNQRYSGNQEELISEKILALNDYLQEDKQITMSQMQSWVMRHKTEKVLTVLNSMYEISQYIKSANAVKLVSFVKKVLDGNGELSGSILQKKEVNIIEVETKKLERLYNDYHELFILYLGKDYMDRKLSYINSIYELIMAIIEKPDKLSILKEMYSEKEILSIVKDFLEDELTKNILYVIKIEVGGDIRPTQMRNEKVYNYIKELVESN